jgi:hypothetical protein
MLAEANTTQRHFEHRKEIICFLPNLTKTAISNTIRIMSVIT